MFTHGCDISKWQDDNTTPQGVDFVKMKDAGIKFVYIRATCGLALDEDFVANWMGAKKAGLLRGAYMAFRSGAGSMEQASLFVGRMQADPGELPPAYDLEHIGIAGLAASETMARSKIIVEYVDKRLSRKMVMYVNPDIIVNYFGNKLLPWFLAHDLWIAHYTQASAPNIGSQYKTWRFWQQTDRGDGVASGVESKQIDLDVFNGSYSELVRYCGLDNAQPVLTLEERVTLLESEMKILKGKII